MERKLAVSLVHPGEVGAGGACQYGSGVWTSSAAPGGNITICCDLLEGNGSILSNGTNGTSPTSYTSSGGGGGGMILIFLNNDNYDKILINFSAKGGTRSRSSNCGYSGNGGSGAVFIIKKVGGVIKFVDLGKIAQ